jgi:hypothetical protein
MRQRRAAGWGASAGPTLAILLLILLIFAVPSVAATTDSAATPGVTVEVIPATLPPCCGETMPVDVIVRNVGPGVTNVRLSFLKYAAGFHWQMHRGAGTASSLMIARLAKGQDADWRLRATATSLYVSGKAYFIVRWTAGRASHIATASLDLQGVPPSKLADLVDVGVQTTLDWLDDKSTGSVYLTVTNKSANRIRVAEVTAEGPPFVSFVAAGLPASEEPSPAPTAVAATPTDSSSSHATALPLRNVVLQPQDTQVVEIPVSASNGVRPGKYVLLFDVKIKWRRGDGKVQTAAVVTTHDTTIGVYGQSEILKAIEAPSILFLPGIVIMAGFTLLVWLLPHKGEGKKLSDIALSGAVAVVLGITLSLPVAVYVPKVFHIDYVSGTYGFGDLVRLWMGSFLVGAVAGSAWWFFKIHKRPGAQEHEAEGRNAAGDAVTGTLDVNVRLASAAPPPLAQRDD